MSVAIKNKLVSGLHFMIGIKLYLVGFKNLFSIFLSFEKIRFFPGPGEWVSCIQSNQGGHGSGPRKLTLYSAN